MAILLKPRVYGGGGEAKGSQQSKNPGGDVSTKENTHCAALKCNHSHDDGDEHPSTAVSTM